MRVVFLLVFLAFVCTVLQSRQAYADHGIRCVQQQLNATGFDLGGSYGNTNQRTETAAAEWLAGQTKEDAKTFPEFSPTTALQWCRKIGEIDSSLRDYWPSHNLSVARTIEDDGSFAKELLERSIQKTKKFFADEHGVELAGAIHVFGADSVEKLNQLYDLSKPDLRFHLDEDRLDNSYLCRSNKWPDAIAQREIVAMCWPAPAEYNQAWFDAYSFVVAFTFAHEYMHHIQYELANDIPAQFAPDGVHWFLGPNWLLEGGADYFQYEFARHSGKLDHSITLQEHFNEVNAPDADKAIKLSELRKYGTVIGSQRYEIAHFAAFLLAERFGEESLFDYWRNLAEHRTWEQAFQVTYGITLDEFEAQFEKAREDESFARSLLARDN